MQAYPAPNAVVQSLSAAHLMAPVQLPHVLQYAVPSTSCAQVLYGLLSQGE